MPLWVDLYGFSDSDQFGDFDMSEAGKRLVRANITPLKVYTLGETTYLVVSSRRPLNVVMAMVRKYVEDQFDGYAKIVSAEDYDMRGKLTVSFIDGR